MFLMGLIWLRVLLNPECMSMLCVMWEASVLVGHLLALQEGSAVGWMTKESSLNIRQGKILSHPQIIQKISEASPASYTVHAQGKMAGPRSKLHLSLYVAYTR
jgi:hypothetical protein